MEQDYCIKKKKNKKKTKQSSTRSTGTGNVAGFKENNVGVPLPSSCDLLFREI